MKFLLMQRVVETRCGGAQNRRLMIHGEIADDKKGNKPNKIRLL